MPSAIALKAITPRTDDREDRRIRAMWGQRSGLGAPAVTEARPRVGADSAVVPTGFLTVTSTGALLSSPSPLAGPSLEIVRRRPRPGRAVPAAAPAGVRFAERFEALRNRVRLPVQKYAELLGTSRRTLYHWLETHRPQEPAIDRVERISELVDALERHLTISEIKELLDPEVADSLGALLLDQGFDAAADRVLLLVEAADRPRAALRLDALADDAGGEPPSAAADELHAVFTAFGEQRPSLPGPKSPPSELTY